MTAKSKLALVQLQAQLSEFSDSIESEYSRSLLSRKKSSVLSDSPSLQDIYSSPQTIHSQRFKNPLSKRISINYNNNDNLFSLSPLNKTTPFKDALNTISSPSTPTRFNVNTTSFKSNLVASPSKLLSTPTLKPAMVQKKKIIKSASKPSLIDRVPNVYGMYNDMKHIHSESFPASAVGSPKYSIKFLLPSAVSAQIISSTDTDLHLFISHDNTKLSPSQCSTTSQSTYSIQMTVQISKLLFPKTTLVVPDSTLNTIYPIKITKYVQKAQPTPNITFRDVEGNAMELQVSFSPPLSPSVISATHFIVVQTRSLSPQEAALKIYEAAIPKPQLEQSRTVSPIPSAFHKRLGPTKASQFIAKPTISTSINAKNNLNGEEQEAADDNDEVENITTTISFTCPLSLRRMQIPAKGKTCKHLQCFDLATFLEFQYSTKNKSNSNNENDNTNMHLHWKCVVCKELIYAGDIVVDLWAARLLEMYPGEERCVLWRNNGELVVTGGGECIRQSRGKTEVVMID